MSQATIMYSNTSFGGMAGGPQSFVVNLSVNLVTEANVPYVANCYADYITRGGITVRRLTSTSLRMNIVYARETDTMLTTYAYVKWGYPLPRFDVEYAIDKSRYCLAKNLGSTSVSYALVPFEDTETVLTKDIYYVPRYADSYSYRGFGYPFIEDKKVKAKTDIELVGDSIKQIVLTQKGERVFRPDFGTNIKALLFENETDFLTNEIISEIKVAASMFEPRATIVSVDVSTDDTTNITYADIVYDYNGIQENVNVELG